jgi:hypothetical protein
MMIVLVFIVFLMGSLSGIVSGVLSSIVFGEEFFELGFVLGVGAFGVVVFRTNLRGNKILDSETHKHNENRPDPMADLDYKAWSYLKEAELHQMTQESNSQEAARKESDERRGFSEADTKPVVPKPGKLFHPTPENFEEYCRDWCLYLGYEGAVKTQNSRDGGIDITSPSMIAQVKFQVSPVGVRPIRELNGVRRQGQKILFFALNSYTPEARRAASEMDITLIRVAPLDGQIYILD